MAIVEVIAKKSKVTTNRMFGGYESDWIEYILRSGSHITEMYMHPTEIISTVLSLSISPV